MQKATIEPNQTVIFLHIPKTAGTTMYRILDRTYGRRRIFVVGADGPAEALGRLPEARRAELRAVAGHAGFGLHRFLPESCAYFTLLREPIDRTISYYAFAKRTPEHYCHDWIHENDVSLVDFIESKIDRMVDNGQTRLLAGLPTGQEAEYGQCTRDMLETAKRNLRDYFPVVGLAEEFDATLILLKKALGWRKLAYVPENVSSHRTRRQELSGAALEALARVNALDVELYAYAKSLFQEQVCQQGPAFARELRRLQAANRRFAPFIRVYWKARQVPVRMMLCEWLSSFPLWPASQVPSFLSPCAESDAA